MVGNARTGPAAPAQSFDPLYRALRQSPGGSVGPGRSITQPRVAFRAVPGEPLVHGASAHPDADSHSADLLTIVEHTLNQSDSTGVC